MSGPTVQTLYRFPVKGFAGQKLDETVIEAGKGIPFDRRYAVTNGVEYEGEWMRSRSFFVNAVVDDMMKFTMDFDGHQLKLVNANGEEINLVPDDEESLSRANQAIAGFMQPVGVQPDLPHPALIDRGRNGAMWDYVDTPISIINAESVRAAGKAMGEELDPLRFRGNIVISGLPAWQEFSWMGKRVRIGGVELDVHRPIDRCPTPGVNPQTGERDIPVTPGLNEHFGHIYCGMYARPVSGGKIRQGDSISVTGDGSAAHEDCIVANASKYAQWPRMAEVDGCRIDKQQTSIRLKATGPWPLPTAKPGQKLRLHLGDQGWTSAYLSRAESGSYEISVEDSKTGDPVTARLRSGFEPGSSVVISGPYGRV